MSFHALLLIAIGLSMDAFGAAVSRGSALTGLRIPGAIRISLVFGLFAAAAPALGWLLGTAFVDVIAAVDHWVAFFLLTAIGAKMIRDAWQESSEPTISAGLRLGIVVGSAIATSIDSAIFGVTVPALKLNLAVASMTVGAATFTAACTGLYVGRIAGAVAGRRAEIGGGLLLIVIACKILADHTWLHVY